MFGMCVYGGENVGILWNLGNCLGIGVGVYC